MSALRFKSTRHETRRFRVSNDFSGSLQTVDGSRSLRVRAIDVSRRGFGFIATEALQIGKHMWLEVGGQKLKVEVAYCESHLGIDHMYKCGVFVRDLDINLELVFSQNGWLAEAIGVDQAS
jgi:hypothetical protein